MERRLGAISRRGAAVAPGEQQLCRHVRSGGGALERVGHGAAAHAYRAGPIEGKVIEIGLTSTSLINPEKLPVIVPNSLFSSQMIVNRSRASWRASVTKIPIRIEDIEKVPSASEAIKEMVRSNPNVSFESDAPYCYLSRLESSYGELTIGCNLKNMKKDEWLSAEQEILLAATRIIKSHGIELGSTMQCC